MKKNRDNFTPSQSGSERDFTPQTHNIIMVDGVNHHLQQQLQYHESDEYEDEDYDEQEEYASNIFGDENEELEQV